MATADEMQAAADEVYRLLDELNEAQQKAVLAGMSVTVELGTTTNHKNAEMRRLVGWCSIPIPRTKREESQ